MPFRVSGTLTPSFSARLTKSCDADGIEHLERTDLPVEAPAHGVVDIDHVVGDLGDAVDRIDQGVADALPGELARPCRCRPTTIFTFWPGLSTCLTARAEANFGLASGL